jgi:hypothetical protein
MILGHAHEPIVKAIQEKAILSTSFGAPTELEIEMAEFLHPEIESVNMVRYFSEKKFLDQTLNAITLTYDPIDNVHDSIPYLHSDV